MAKPKMRKTAASRDPVRRPVNWDKVISVAYLRLLGASQSVAAEQAGASERSVRSWEACSWWKDALVEARQRWLRGGDAAAMRGLLKALSSETEYATTSRWWADRRIPELAPPNQKVDATISGPDGAPLVAEIVFVNSDGDGHAEG